MPGTLTIYRAHFNEDDIYDGDVDYFRTDEEVHDDISASDAARLIQREGLSFAATGSSWAADPDGSHVVDYCTGERVETSAHLSDYPDRVAAAIVAVVG